MKVALCCIGRLENRYIKEFVEYYKHIGVDKIFIYDNNRGSEEYFEDVILEYIENNFVEISNFRDKEVCQILSYQDCYDKHKDEYDWFCFFDIDEYLTFKEEGINIKTFLGGVEFEKFDMIHVNWMIYDDNNLVRYDGRPVYERFTKPFKPLDFKYDYDFPENNHIKSIVRGGLDTIKWDNTSHTPNGINTCCNPSGKPCNPMSPFATYDFSVAWLKHFRFKTIEEWVEIKMKRGVGDRTIDNFLKKYDVNVFFKQNERTEEKIRYLNSIKVKHE